MVGLVANTGFNGWSGWLASLDAHANAADPTSSAARIALSRTTRVLAVAGVLAAGLLAATLPPRDANASLHVVGSIAQRPELTDAPATLAETGLYSDWSSKTIAADLLPFSPQYPLWSDGATKQRWIYLPAAIDASWTFPIGTRIWKQFSFGQRTETRFMARTQTGWTYATYVWHGDAALRSDGETISISPTRTHRVPSSGDCRACHGNAASPVLGFTPLQLSIDRDPAAPHRERAGVDLLSLSIAGYVSVDSIAPRIPGPPVQRAALGYLYGNCGGCHREEGPLAGLGMNFAEPARVLATTTNVTARFAPEPRLAPGDSQHSLLVRRMASRQSLTQMPPNGTDVVDAEALRLIASWIDQL